ncbi:MAG: hypothetical protein NW203_03645 [Hyphomonadaceae bacterium]|nr:hypothetical protein [Hyphomonadaceae bacterium]
MRRPSDRAQAWAWWSAALSHAAAPHPQHPQCGLFRIRIAGLWRAASIDIEQPTEDGELIGDERLVCIVDGEERDADAMWPRLDPVSEHEFQRLQRAPRVRDLSREFMT